MKNYSLYSTHSPLIGIAPWMRQQGIWEEVTKRVSIPQKVVRYRPTDKLLGVLVTILAGAGGLVEANTRVRPDEALWRAFGFESFPDQSTLSETLNASTEESVKALRESVTAIYRRHGRAPRHKPEKGWLIMDVDLTGLPCGRRAEEATKGYFSGARGRRGRQLGRVVATNYGEIVIQALYPGKKQLSQAFRSLVEEAEKVLGLDGEAKKREKVLLRADGGGGTEKEINWALERGYHIITKLKNHQRTQKLVRSVARWYPDPKVPGRYVGWVEEPHPFARPTLQVAVRTEREGKEPKHRVIVTSLSEKDVVLLMGWTLRYPLDPYRVALAVAHLYDLRGGGVETENRQDKQGLGLTKRNKKRFLAQQMLVLLAELAHNLATWIRHHMAQVNSRWRGWGIQRLVRDVFHIPGKVQFGENDTPQRLILSSQHPLSKPLIQAWQLLVGSELVIILDKI